MASTRLAGEGAGYGAIVLDLLLPGMNGYQVCLALPAAEVDPDPYAHRQGRASTTR